MFDRSITVLGRVLGVTPSEFHLPAVTARGAPPGGVTEVDVYAEGTRLPTLLFVSMPAARPTPTAFGPVWLDPATTVLVHQGMGTGEWQTVRVPFSSAFPLGLPVLFQAGVLYPNGTARVSQPGVTALH